MALKQEYIVREKVLIIRLAGEIDHHEAIEFRKNWQGHISDEGICHVIMNLSGVNFMDSSGIGVILGRYKEIVSRGGELIVCHISPAVERLFSMAGLNKIIRIEENEELALVSLGVAS